MVLPSIRVSRPALLFVVVLRVPSCCGAD
jgi:hypothetical protein